MINVPKVRITESSAVLGWFLTTPSTVGSVGKAVELSVSCDKVVLRLCDTLVRISSIVSIEGGGG